VPAAGSGLRHSRADDAAIAALAMREGSAENRPMLHDIREQPAEADIPEAEDEAADEDEDGSSDDDGEGAADALEAQLNAEAALARDDVDVVSLDEYFDGVSGPIAEALAAQLEALGV
jgi:hypothetical protein